MINENLVALANNLTTQYNNKNYNIKPIERTPLAALVSTMNCKNIENFDTNSLYNGITKGMEDAKIPGERNTQYDIMLNLQSEALATKLKEHINYIRTIVVPYIDDVDDNLKKYIEKLSPADILNYTIEIKTAPELFSNAEFLGMVNNFADSIIYSDELPTKPIFPALTEETSGEIKKLLSTGNFNFDSMVEKYFYTEPEDAKENLTIYNTVFSRKSKRSIPKLSTLFNPRDPEGIKYAILTFIIGCNIFDNPPEGLQITLTEYKKGIRNLIGQAGHYIKLAIENFETAIKRKRLIITSEKGKTVVNGPLYQKWIEEMGGDSDVILGNSLRKQPYFYLDELINNKEDLLRNWRMYTSVLENKDNVKRLESIKTKLYLILIDKFKEELKNGTMSEEDFPSKKNLAIRELDYLSLNDILDDQRLNDAIVKIVCKSRFPGTDADFTLGSIQKIASEKDGIDIKEAALIGTINYAAQWVASQLKLEKSF